MNWQCRYLISKPLRKWHEKRLIQQITAQRDLVPTHVGIIVDGNRRYAKAIGLPTTAGHEYASRYLRKVIDWTFGELAIPLVTLYVFSLENFQRPPAEVDALMALFAREFATIGTDPVITRNEVQITTIGDLSLLPNAVIEAIALAKTQTDQYSKHILQFAIAYSGRDELVRAVRNIITDYRGQNGDTLTEARIAYYLDTKRRPDPDLIIRTSGEQRLSGFLTWQSAYAELYFCQSTFPAMTKLDFLRAIRSYQQRQRRFGK